MKLTSNYLPSNGVVSYNIPRNGASELYGGLTGELLAKDIKDAGGIITLKVVISSNSQFKNGNVRFTT